MRRSCCVPSRDPVLAHRLSRAPSASILSALRRQLLRLASAWRPRRPLSPIAPSAHRYLAARPQAPARADRPDLAPVARISATPLRYSPLSLSVGTLARWPSPPAPFGS